LKNKHKIAAISNDDLLQLFIEGGDIAYFGELYRRYIPLLYGLCLKYLNDKEAAHDAVMDIYSNLPEKVIHYEIKNFNSWLYSVAKNHCLQVQRKDKQTIFVKIEDAYVENEDFFTQIDKAQTQEEISALEYCITTLNEEQQKSIQLFFYEEKSYLDIVEITGFELSKVKSYIQNGKRNLKTCIMKVLKNTL
jgi:RNA polymerase sigma-70 factor (ECF subfamily)